MCKQEMERANITSKKVTHTGRGSGARHAQEMGAGIEEIAQHGNWNNSRVVLFYLSGIPKDVPHKLAGFRGQGERSWLARNTLVPPLELQRKLWPFIEDLFPGGEDGQKWIENIMMDRDRYHGRPSSNRHIYSSDDFNQMRLMALLTHLRKIVLQDAIVLMRKTEDPSCVYSQHHIFKDSVFRDPLFLQFSKDLRQSMETASPPSTDSLRANAPALHHEFRAINDRLNSMSLRTIRIDEKLEKLDGFENSVNRLIDAHRDQFQQEQDDRNARELRFLETMRDATEQRLTYLRDMNSGQHRHQLGLQLHKSRQDQIHVSLPEFFRPRQQQHQLQQPRQLPRLLQQPHQQDQQDQQEDRQEDQQEQEQQEQPHPQVEGEDQNQPHGHQLQDLAHGQPVQVEQASYDEKTAIRILASRIASPQAEPQSPEYLMIDRSHSFEEHWQEWFRGVSGEPSIWTLDNAFGNSWRSGSNSVAKLYQFKKQLIESGLRVMLAVDVPSLPERQNLMFERVLVQINNAGSLNKYYDSLPKGSSRGPKGPRGPRRNREQ
jgi:hypothetical protein